MTRAKEEIVDRSIDSSGAMNVVARRQLAKLAYRVRKESRAQIWG